MKRKLSGGYPYLLSALLLTAVFSACKKSVLLPDAGNPEVPQQEQATPLITVPGTAIGDAESQYIGTGGGQFAAMDGAVKIKVPAGGLQSGVTFVVQRISGPNAESPAPAWRISPHTTFQKPVELTVNYPEAFVDNSVPAALGLAYQDENGAWQGMGGVIDTVHKTITVTTTHFSDWSLFKSFEILPASAVVEPGKSLALTIGNNLVVDDLEVPEVATVKSLAVRRDLLAAYIRNWKLNGAGQLSPVGRGATYTAPASVPAVNPVAVSVLLKSPDNRQYSLVSNIYIGKPGITFRINNGKWLHAVDALDATPADGNMIIGGGVVAEGKQLGAVWMGFKDAYSLRFIPWQETLPYFVYGAGDNIVYRHFTASQSGVSVSPGGILFASYSNQPGGNLTGTFYLDQACKQVTESNGTQLTTVKIDGFFMVKRAR